MVPLAFCYSLKTFSADALLVGALLSELPLMFSEILNTILSKPAANLAYLRGLHQGTPLFNNDFFDRQYNYHNALQ